jgi:hypothetical protein
VLSVCAVCLAQLIHISMLQPSNCTTDTLLQDRHSACLSVARRVCARGLYTPCKLSLSPPTHTPVFMCLPCHRLQLKSAPLQPRQSLPYHACATWQTTSQGT